MEFEDLSSEMKALVTITKHVRLVQKYLKLIAMELEKRAQLHDLSKLSQDEFAGFVEINQIARQYPYGSKEYKKSLKGNETIDLHFSRNNHHPEYYINGIDDMSLMDIIEMVCDWKAASETYGNTTLKDAIPQQVERFNIKPHQVSLIDQIVDILEKC